MGSWQTGLERLLLRKLRKVPAKDGQWSRNPISRAELRSIEEKREIQNLHFFCDRSAILRLCSYRPVLRTRFTSYRKSPNFDSISSWFLFGPQVYLFHLSANPDEFRTEPISDSHRGRMRPGDDMHGYRQIISQGKFLSMQPTSCSRAIKLRQEETYREKV